MLGKSNQSFKELTNSTFKETTGLDTSAIQMPGDYSALVDSTQQRFHHSSSSNPISTDFANSDDSLLGSEQASLFRPPTPGIIPPDIRLPKPIPVIPSPSIPVIPSPSIQDLLSGKAGNYNTKSPSEFPASDLPLVGIIDTGFSSNNPNLHRTQVFLGRDRIDGDKNPLVPPGSANQHGNQILNTVASKDGNAPLWLGRAVGSGKWSESLVEFVNAAKVSGQPNAVVNLSFDLSQIGSNGNVRTRTRLTPKERAALEYARQNGVIIVTAAGNTGETMSALGQASREFDNIITVGAAEGSHKANYSAYGNGLTVLADGRANENPLQHSSNKGAGDAEGTSIATAKVTAVVSQAWAANPNLTYRQVIDIIKSTARDLETPGWDAQTGNGLVNADAAINKAAKTSLVTFNEPTQVIPKSDLGIGVMFPTNVIRDLVNNRVVTTDKSATLRLQALSTEIAGSNLIERPALLGVPIPGVDDAIEAVKKKAQEVVETAAKPIVQATETVVKPVVHAAETVVKPVVHAAETVVKPVVHAAETVVKPVVHAAETITKPIINAPKAVAHEAVNIARDVHKISLNFLKHIGSGAFNGVKDVRKGSFDIVKHVSNGSSDVAKHLGNGVVNVAGNIGKGTVSIAKDIEHGVANVAGDISRGAVNIAKNVEHGVVNVAGDISRGAVNIAKDVGNGVVNVAGDISRGDFSGALNDAGKTVVVVTKDAGKTAFDIAKDADKTAFDIAKDAGKTAFNVAKDEVSTAFDVVKDQFHTSGKVLGTLVNTADKVIGTTVHMAENLIEDEVGIGKNLVGDVLHTAGSILEPIVPAPIASTVSKVGSKIGEGIDKATNFAWNGAKWLGDQSQDKYSGIIQREIYFAENLPDRVERLGSNLWHGNVGGSLVSLGELAGLGEVYETGADLLKFNTRKLTDHELQIARSVFGDSINYDLVRIDKGALIGSASTHRPYTSFHTINSYGYMDDATLIHELTHVWQYEHDGAIYMPEALKAQKSPGITPGTDGYDYGGVAELKKRQAAGQSITGFNREQQAHIVEDYYKIKNDRNPNNDKDLSTYVHFVKEVSTKPESEL